MKVYARSDWGARDPIFSRLAVQSSPTEAFLHHSSGERGADFATLATQRKHVRGIQDFHMGPSRGWADIGYHFMVFQFVGTKDRRVQPRVFQCRLTKYVPAAQEGHNTRTLAICVVGNGDAEPIFDETEKVIAELIRKFPTVKTLRPHGAVTQTDCPGRHFRASIPDIARRAHVAHQESTL